RGPLFGVDDEALYLFSRAGGRFSFRAALPEGADPRIATACEFLREGEALAAALPPAAAIARLCGRLGWTAYGAARQLGAARDMLVVSIWKQGKSETAQGPWSPLAPYLREDLREPAHPPPAGAPPPLKRLPEERSAFARRQEARREESGRPTYAVTAVTGVA